VRPGEVTTDQQAFQQVLGRLEGDVGTLIQLVIEGQARGYFPNTAPFWALVRMMLPIAESVGDLIYRATSTATNLISVLETDFEAVRAGYLGKAKILAQLYRHSLIHQDELRSLRTGGKECRWVVSFDERAHHLKVTQAPPDVSIQFDTTAFYDDLIAVCRSAQAKQWNDEVKNRYNSWLVYDLDPERNQKRIAEVIAEIGRL
jgi:hypothetical protein